MCLQQMQRNRKIAAKKIQQLMLINLCLDENLNICLYLSFGNSPKIKQIQNYYFLNSRTIHKLLVSLNKLIFYWWKM